MFTMMPAKYHTMRAWCIWRLLIMTVECTWGQCLEWLAWFHPTPRYFKMWSLENDISHFSLLNIHEFRVGSRHWHFLLSIISKQDKKKTMPVKQSDVKRTRRDRGELEDIMFKLFERQPNWALKQLVQETDQPVVSLSTFLYHNLLMFISLFELCFFLIFPLDLSYGL